MELEFKPQQYDPISLTMFTTGKTTVMIKHQYIINFIFALGEGGGGMCLTF